MLSISKKIINIFFLVIITALFVMSLCVHCEMDIYSYIQVRTIEHHRMSVYVVSTLASAILILLLYTLINRIMSKVKNPEKTSTIILIVCTLIVFASGVFWINFNDCMPKNDQITLYNEARKIAGYLREPYSHNYMACFKRQRAFTLLMAAALRLFGDAQTSVGIINVIGAAALLVGICKTVYNITNDKSYIVLIAATLTLFYPIVIYTTFMYGTLLSLTFSVWGFYSVIKFCKSANRKYAVLAAFGFPMGILMHQSAAVAAIAGIIYLLVHINRKNALKNGLSVAAIILMVILSLRLTNITYEKLTDAPPGDSVPPTATIYMGLNAETPEGGPGSQDGSFVKIFAENHEDGAATNRDAINRIKVILSDYATGKRSLSFFVRKTEYQWMDPTMGARKTIIPNDSNYGEPPNSAAFRRFYDSSLRKIIFRISDIFMILVYGFAAVSGIFTLVRKDGTDDEISVHFLIQLFFIGGFAFQLMWETLPRYCFPYFVWLIPEAIYGVHQLCQLTCKVKKGH